MARVLLSFVALFFAVTGCATPTGDPPARPSAPGTVPTAARSSSTTVPSPAASTRATITIKATSEEKRPLGDQRRAACRKDENQCYEPGTNKKCQTGGCVNAARGVTQRDGEAERDKWLRDHPGWCPAGTQGAVAPC